MLPGCGSAWKKPSRRIIVAENLDQLLRDHVLVDSGALERCDVGDLNALDQLHRQHAPRRELAIDLGHADDRIAPRSCARIVSALSASWMKSSSIGMYFSALARDHAKIEVALEPREPLSTVSHDCADRRGRCRRYPDTAPSPRIDARRAGAPDAPARATPTRAAPDRTRRKRASSGRPSSRSICCADHRERARRHAVVQARERRDPFVGQNIGASRDKLAGLDQQAFEPNRGAVKRARGAQILAPIELGLVAIADEARPELRRLCSRRKRRTASQTTLEKRHARVARPGSRHVGVENRSCGRGCWIGHESSGCGLL